jgi:predicted nucleic-acid-binding protein
VIGLDTNVLVRYLVEDDPEQCQRAARMIEDALGRGEVLFIPDLVVCELVWVLEAAYRLRREKIAAVLDRLFRAEQLRFAAPHLLFGALAAYRRGGAGFADHLILEQCRAAGCEVLATFDRRLLREPRTLEPGRDLPG